MVWSSVLPKNLEGLEPFNELLRPNELVVFFGCIYYQPASFGHVVDYNVQCLVPERYSQV